MTTTTFAKVAQAWYATAEKYARFGASDTEPRAEFAAILIDLRDGRDPQVPNSIEGWQLFSEMKGATKAALALTAAAKNAVEAGKADLPGLVRYLKAQGWA